MSKLELIHGDCLVEMQRIPDKSVDMVLCDLPYGTTACKWDVIIPFDKLWEQYRRIVKDNGAIVLFGSQPFTSMLVASNANNYREELIWLKNKPASGLMYDKRHLKIHENIIVFSFAPNYTYNPQKWLVDKKEFLTQRKTFKENEYIGNNIYGKTTRTRKPDDGTRNPISILSCRTPHSSSYSKSYTFEEIRFHPTQKPVVLLEYLIKTYSNEGDTILDNTMGSGSTMVACVNTKRNGIGIELDDNYFKIAQERVKRAQQQLTLF